MNTTAETFRVAALMSDHVYVAVAVADARLIDLEVLLGLEG